MTLDYGIGALLSVCSCAYLVYALIRPESSEEIRHDRHRLAADPRLLRRDPRGHAARWASTCSACSRATRSRSRACSGRFERLLYRAVAASTRSASRPGRSTRSRCWCSAPSACSSPTLIQRLQQRAAVQPAAPRRPSSRRSAFNTAASFTTNTNWQSYSGESTMSYLTQMAGLAWHNFTSAAVGIGVALALGARLHAAARARRRRRRSATSGSI